MPEEEDVKLLVLAQVQGFLVKNAEMWRLRIPGVQRTYHFGNVQDVLYYLKKYCEL